MGRGTTGLLLLLLLLAGSFGLGGCGLGTMNTKPGLGWYGTEMEARVWNDDSLPPGEDAVFGSFPFSAVAFDVGFLFSDPEPVCTLMWREGDWVWKALTLVSLPLDVLADAVCLPVDLGAWAAGYRKAWPFDEKEIERCRKFWALCGMPIDRPPK